MIQETFSTLRMSLTALSDSNGSLYYPIVRVKVEQHEPNATSPISATASASASLLVS